MHSDPDNKLKSKVAKDQNSCWGLRRATKVQRPKSGLQSESKLRSVHLMKSQKSRTRSWFECVASMLVLPSYTITCSMFNNDDIIKWWWWMIMIYQYQLHDWMVWTKENRRDQQHMWPDCWRGERWESLHRIPWQEPVLWVERDATWTKYYNHHD